MHIPHAKWFGGVVAFTLASGWIGVALNRLMDQPNAVESAGSLVWLASPLAAVAAVRLTRRSTAPSGWGISLPRSLPWYGLGAAAFPGVTALGVLIGREAGWIDTSNFDIRALAGTFISLIGVNLVKNVFEEAVWRGYITSELLERKLTDSQVYLAVGLIWGLWHLPYYLYFLPGSDMASVWDTSRPAFAAMAVITMVAWTVPFTELYRLTGSIWPCVVMHAVEDAFINNLLIDGHIRIDRGREVLVSPVVGLVPMAMYVALGLALRAWRRSHPGITR